MPEAVSGNIGYKLLAESCVRSDRNKLLREEPQEAHIFLMGLGPEPGLVPLSEQGVLRGSDKVGFRALPLWGC